MRNFVLRKTNIVLSGLLALLGFSSCERYIELPNLYGPAPMDSIGTTVPMYGVPEPQFGEYEDETDESATEDTESEVKR